jgi:F0F1-type ATP synthase membrane subunit b/b'
METLSTSTFLSLITVSNGLASANAAYLAISVSILIFLGGLTYLFNVKPLQEKIEKQQKDLESQKGRNEEKERKLEKLEEEVKEIQKEAKEQTEKLKNTIESKIVDAERRVGILEKTTEKTNSKLTKDIHHTELTILATEQFLWRLGGLAVPANAFRALAEYAEKYVEYNPDFPAISFDIISSMLENSLDCFKDDGSPLLDRKGGEALYSRIHDILTKLNGDNKKTVELLDKTRKYILGNK